MPRYISFLGIGEKLFLVLNAPLIYLKPIGC